MGDRENEFRNQLRIVSNDKSSIPDKRSAQQRAIDGARKMTPRDLKTTTNSDPFEEIIESWARRVYNIETPTVSKEEQGSYECDRDGE